MEWYTCICNSSASNSVRHFIHDDVIKWKHFPRYWPFVRGIHRSPVNSPHKGQWRGALMFTLICARINGWVKNREAGDLRRYRPPLWRHHNVPHISQWRFPHDIISKAWCKTTAFPLLTHWEYCSLALSHRYVPHISSHVLHVGFNGTHQMSLCKFNYCIRYHIHNRIISIITLYSTVTQFHTIIHWK